MDHLIGDIAMDEDLTGEQAGDLVGRNPGVGAADPEVFRVLELGQAMEEIRIFRPLALGPDAILFEQVLQLGHGKSSSETGRILPQCNIDPPEGGDFRPGR